ncbi:transferase hexapeptide (six repeat-containing protein) [Modicisalibacter muralis]|uniref:Transferase hexapeptide (Six repeat-containing protein) n=1 Tax=Modicisalibacter muralis TaxID=119000 RepID=A0A1G9LZ24_9GAMM|nr:acetyltransferase [Halomonas muralis]SDL67252.1 transferase hexapeptide (six repeat-containing protein) [Halomonas muralis]
MRLAVFGAGGHGKVVADTALQMGWQEVVFFEDAWPKRSHNGCWLIIGDAQALLQRLDDFQGVIVGVGNNRIRLAKTRELAAHGARLVSVVHPSAVISPHAVLGRGSVVFAGAVIQVDSQLGEACIVNTRACVDHDCHLADGVHICPGASLAGSVEIGEASWIGIGSSVKQQVRLGSDVIVGAGAAVVCDVLDKQTVVGVPAKSLGRK